MRRNVLYSFMLPPLQTFRGALRTAQTISDLSERLSMPIAVETTVNYLRPLDGELQDGDFVAVATSEANCGIVLDLHNIWTNARNGRQAVKDFLAAIPLDRVWELHLAGGFEFDGYWLDAHSGAPADEVFDLAEDLIPALPNLKAVIFEVFPSFVPLLGADGIRAQIRRLEAHYSSCPEREGVGVSTTSQKWDRPENRCRGPDRMGDNSRRIGRLWKQPRTGRTQARG